MVENKKCECPEGYWKKTPSWSWGISMSIVLFIIIATLFAIMLEPSHFIIGLVLFMGIGVGWISALFALNEPVDKWVKK